MRENMLADRESSVLSAEVTDREGGSKGRPENVPGIIPGRGVGCAGRGLPPERIHEAFSYDPEAGLITRLPSGRPVFAKLKKGYLCAKWRGVQYLAHRIAWASAHGALPPVGMLIDHINGDPADNRLVNLRLATPAQNVTNSRILSTNTTGFKGVTLNKQARKYRAHIMTGDRQIYLGTHETAEAAHAAYCEAAARLFGEFARVS